MNVLNINDLRFQHCGPVNLQIHAAEIIGLSGESGTGKSLLLRALADLDAHQGEISLDQVRQQDICAHQWRHKVALLSADTHWWFDTVGEHFEKMPTDYLQKLGFEQGISGWQVSRLSSGEKQRLGLLRLLVNEPAVLLLDEPTANLDQKNTLLFEEFVMSYIREKSACVVWVSHDIDQLKRVCQRSYTMCDGVLTREEGKL